jgi:hypothetical protein
MALKEQGKSASGDADIDGLPEAIEDQHVLVEH